MSVNIVNKTTGDLTRVAGNATDKVGNLNALTTTDKSSCVGAINELFYRGGGIGNLSNLTTTDKSSCVGAINEVNGFFANLGSFTVNDLNTFFKSSVIAFHQLNPIAHKGYSVVTDWAYNGRFTGFFTDYTDSVDFVIAGGDNKRIFCGRYLIQADVLEIRTYMNSDKEYSLVNLNSSYEAGTDWNIVKQGNICVMNMRNLKDIPVGNTVIGTIPVGFRPEWSFYEYVYSLSKDVHVGFNIADNGDIQVINQTGTALSGTVYVNRNVTYFTA